MLLFRLHALAGLLPEPVRHYCTNIRCILETQQPTTDPLTLLRGLYPNALPQELAEVAPGLVGKQLLPQALKAQLVNHITEQVFTGRELRHRKWCEVKVHDCINQRWKESAWGLEHAPHRACLFLQQPYLSTMACVSLHKTGEVLQASLLCSRLSDVSC